LNCVLFNKTELHFGENKLISAFLPRRDKRAVHLLKVLHKKTEDSFDAGVLEDKLGTGTIFKITAEGLHITLTLETEPPPRTSLCLGVGFPRPIQLRRLLRDCASLGLAAVDLICTELGEKSYRDTKLLSGGGARSAFIEGAVQARDTRLPALAVFSCLAAWLEKVTAANNGSALFAADNDGPQGSFSGLKMVAHEKGTVWAVGPERGWSNRERDQLEQAGFVRLSLGKRALRTETACTAAAILVMEKMGLLE
jgi:RsmE family RNA methyltransferase